MMYEYFEDKTVKYRDHKSEAPFFQSLLHKHNVYTKPTDSKEEMIRDNELHFIEGPSANVDGPFKYLSEERINAIHLEID